MQSPQSFLTYESDILYSLRFMVDCSITGGQWVTLPAAGYQVQPRHARLSHCQHELHAHYSKLISHPSDGQAPTRPGSWSFNLLSAPPLRVAGSRRPCAFVPSTDFVHALRSISACPRAEVCSTDIEDISAAAQLQVLRYFLWWCTMRCPDAGKWLKLAPLRILSMDIECAGRKVSVADDTALHESGGQPTARVPR